jgi:hypothetical protein
VLSIVAGLAESTNDAVLVTGKEVIEAGPDRRVAFQAPSPAREWLVTFLKDQGHEKRPLAAAPKARWNSLG